MNGGLSIIQMSSKPIFSMAEVKVLHESIDRQTDMLYPKEKTIQTKLRQQKDNEQKAEWST